jgi:hypothetical protein
VAGTVTISVARYARMCARIDFLADQVRELTAANCVYMQTFSDQMDRIADLENSVETLVAPVIQVILYAPAEHDCDYVI